MFCDHFMHNAHVWISWRSSFNLKCKCIYVYRILKSQLTYFSFLKLHLLNVLSNNVSLEYWYWILVVTSLPSFLFLLCVNYLVYASAFILKDAIHLTVTFFYEHCRYIKEKFVILMKCLINQNHLLISNM